jgi:hypothetical protein
VTTGPWTIDQAKDACREASRRQEAAEKTLTEAARDFARAEEAYRLKLAEAIIEIHAKGIAWTVAPDVARGRKDVAALRRERDIKEGVREAMQQAAWRCGADRKDAQRFADWSMRREIAEGYGD